MDDLGQAGVGDNHFDTCDRGLGSGLSLPRVRLGLERSALGDGLARVGDLATILLRALKSVCVPRGVARLVVDWAFGAARGVVVAGLTVKTDATRAT
jgi:hypothetical protein